jgi:hypothetical protein
MNFLRGILFVFLSYDFRLELSAGHRQAQLVYLRYIQSARSRESENPVESCIGFDWDEWNASKNWNKHRVTPDEAESIFFHDPLLLRSDAGHSMRKSDIRKWARRQLDGD